MASITPTQQEPEWVKRRPEAFSIVTGFFPETKPKDGKASCRPLLITQVLRHKETGQIAMRVAYGTSKIRFPEAANRDLIVQNISDLDACGLMTPTRFVVNPKNQIVRPWTQDFFRPWGAALSPRRGKLTQDLQHEYAWLMAQYLRS